MNGVLKRCGWCEGDPLYEAYHDKEWGVPVKEDAILFEFLILETFQAGLSWITILRKRENFRAAFDAFDYQKIAEYKSDKIEELLLNPGIVRNKLKINATISNARAFMKIQKEFGTFSTYIWGFVNNSPIKNTINKYKEGPSKTSISDSLSQDLKKRGFKFVGSTVIYAHMQATGMVNDHEISCFRYEEV
ncbi:MAG: DNA-3-methyladenine glycosylase I [Eudoraea sp.]|uniref:DNA-3-methyladenine glycosylase I n=3 Tax=Eudoraea sp. TaxID=1979955 RepID=UPI003C75E883